MLALLSVTLEGGSVIDLDGTVFVQFVLFWLLFAFLYALVFKPMMKLFAAREEAIDGAREQAKKLEADARDKGDAFDAELRKVKVAAGEERDRLRAEGAKLERQILEKVRHETQASSDAARKRLEEEAAKVRSEQATVVPALARQVASRLLGREVR